MDFEDPKLHDYKLWYSDEPLRPFKFNFKKLMTFAGPGLLMSIAYLDPGNIAGDLDAGIAGGYKLIWTLMWSTILGLYFQTLSAKIGVCTQRNLARVCREQQSPFTRYVFWIMTELAIIGCDIQEVVGSATAINILTGWPLWVGAIVTIFDSFLFLFIHYYGVRKLEYFFLFLIAMMTFMFCGNMYVAKPDFGAMLEGALIPTVPAGAWPAAIGLIGAVIMPHNLYLHSSLVLTRKVDYRNRTAVNEAHIYNAMESAVSLFISFVISTSVISTFAVYVGANPEVRAVGLNLDKASGALSSKFGDTAKYVWAVGLLASGQSATMTGTYAGQFVMEGFLDIKLPVYQRVLLTRAIAIVPALCVAFFDQNSMIGLDTILNIIQSIQLPFALVPTIKFASSPDIMKEFAIPRWQWLPASAFGTGLFLMNFVLIFQKDTDFQWYHHVMIVVASLFYFFVIVKAILEPTTPLSPITQEDLDNHEYDQIEVESEM